MKGLVVAALAAAVVFGVSAADFEISIDPKAKPIKDMRKTGCNQGMGFNAALEQVWGVASDDYWFVTNKVYASKILKEAGANLLRLQCMRSWWNRGKPNPYDKDSKDPKERQRYRNYRPTNPKAAFDFYKENGIKVWVCLECWNTNDVPNCVEIVKWLVDNDYKGVVAGIEMGNESYGAAPVPPWVKFIHEAEKIWPKLPLGINIAELFELNPDLAHMKARLESQDPLQRNGYFTAAGYNQNSTRFVKELAASNVLGKIGHIIWHAYGCEEPYSCSYYGMKRFRNYVDMYPELLKDKKWWLTEVRPRSDEDNHSQRLYRDMLIMAHYSLMALCQPEVDGFGHHQLTALSGALYQSDGRNWYVQWYDSNQNSIPDYRAGGNLPRMEVGHMGVMYRIYTEAIRNNPVFLMHGTSKECNTEDAFYTSARIGTQVYEYRKQCKERKEPFLGIFGGKRQIEGETEYVVSTDGRGRYCLLMVNTKPEKQTIRVTMPGHQFAAPMYRTLTCPEKYLDCRAVPGEGQPWRQLSWEDTQSGFATWSNWDSKESKPGHCSYTPLPSGVDPKCDDMIVEIEPHTVQSVEFYVRKQPVAK